jgi:hypothetical protein
MSKPTFREELKNLISKVPSFMGKNDEISEDRINLLFDFLDSHNKWIVEFLYHTNKCYSSNIKKDHIAKNQLDDIINEVNILGQIIRIHLDTLNEVIDKQTKDKNEKFEIVYDTFNKRRFISSYNSILIQLVNASESLIKKINDSMDHLFNTTTNNSNMHY